MGSNERWTKPELASLRELAGEISVREIAHRLNRSEQAIRFKAWQERLKLSIDKGPYDFSRGL